MLGIWDLIPQYFGYCMGLKIYPYNFEVYLRFMILHVYKEYGTIVISIPDPCRRLPKP